MCRPEGGVGPGEYHRERDPEGPAFTIPGARRSVEAREVTAGPGEYHGCGLRNSGTAWTMGQKPKARVRCCCCPATNGDQTMRCSLL